MKQNWFIIIFLIGISDLIGAQTALKPAIEFEAASNFIIAKSTDNWSIRQNQWYYNSSETNYATASSNLNLYYFGIKPVVYLCKNKLALSGGIRYSYLNGELLPSSNSGFFYLRSIQNTNGTDLYRVNAIVENQHFIGTSFDVKYFFENYEPIAFYGKVGGSLNFRLATQRDIHFYDENMEVYQEQLINETNTRLNSVFSTLTLAIGMRIGKENKTNLNTELILPSSVLSNNNSSLFKPSTFLGIQLSLVIPISKKTEKTPDKK